MRKFKLSNSKNNVEELEREINNDVSENDAKDFQLQEENMMDKKIENKNHFIQNTKLGKKYKNSKGSLEVITVGTSMMADHKNPALFLENDLTFTNEKECFESKKNRFSSRFSKDISSKQLVSLTNNECNLFLDFIGRKHNGKIIEKKKVEGKLVRNSKNLSKVRYENFENGIDLEYDITTYGVKESIIINEKKENYIFDFTINTNGLIASFDEETKTLELLKDDKAIYRILSPYMKDANNDISLACSYDIEEKDNGNLRVTLVADAAWINDDSHTLPIIIDPTIEVANNDVIKLEQLFNDADLEMIHSAYTIGKNTMTTTHKLGIKINSKIIRESMADKMKKVFLTLFVELVDGSSSTRTIDFTSGSTIITKIPKNEIGDKIELDITSLINQNTNSIDIIASCQGTIPDLEVRIYTMYCDNDDCKPSLQIEYYDEEVEEEKSTSKSYSIGKAGQTNINLFNGSFIHSHYDASIQHNSLKIDINHVFNSKLYSETSIDKKEKFMGCGWKSSLNQYLVKNENYNKLLGSKDCTYIDANGYKHEFHEKWYYIKEQTKVFIEKKNIYLDSDLKLKFKDTNEKIYEVKYELANNEGLSLISAASLYNYVTIDQVSQKFHLYLDLINYKWDLYLNKDGSINVPLFRSITTPLVYYNYGEVKFSYSKDAFVDANNKVVDFIFKKVFPLIDDNGLYFELDAPSFKINYHFQVENFIDKDSVITIDNQFVTDEMKNLDSQIESYKTAKKDIISSIKSSLSGITLLNGNLANANNSLKDFNDLLVLSHSLSDPQQEFSDKFEDYYSSYGKSYLDYIISKTSDIKVDSSTGYVLDNTSGNDDSKTPSARTNALSLSGQVNTVQGLLKSKNLRSTRENYTTKSETFQKISYEQNISNIEQQLYSSAFQLTIMYDKYNEYILKLKQLSEKRLALVENQKKVVNDIISDNNGNLLGFDGYGRLVKIQDKYENKIEVEYGYDDKNEGQILSVFSDTQKVKFHYRKEDKFLDYIINNRGLKTKFTYVGQYLSSIKYADGTTTQFDYTNGFSVMNSLKEKIELYVTGNKVKKVYSYCYNGNIDKSTKALEENSFKAISKEVYAYDTLPNSTTIYDELVNANGTGDEKIIHYFDLTSKLVRSTDKEQTTNKFYAANRLISEVTYKNNAFLAPVQLNSIQNKKYSIDLMPLMIDSTGKKDNNLPTSNMLGLYIKILTGQVDNLPILSFTLSAIVHTVNPDGSTTKTEFKQSYQEVKLQEVILPIAIDREQSYQIDVQLTTNAADFTAGYIGEIDLIPLESGTIYDYDAENHCIKEQNGYTLTTYEDFIDGLPTRKTVKHLYKTDGVVTTYAFNDQKQLAVEEDSLGNIKEYYYDDKGQTVETRSYNKKDASLLQVEKYAYDGFGKAVAIDGKMKDTLGNLPKEEVSYLPNTTVINKVKDVNGATTCYNHDPLTGELISKSKSAQGSNNATSYSYNFGLMTSISHHGVKVDYKYDGRGRKIDTFINDESQAYLHNEFIDNYSSVNSPYDNELKIRHGAYQKSQLKSGAYSESFINQKGQNLKSIIANGSTTYVTNNTYIDDLLAKSKVTYNENGSQIIETIENTYNDFGNVTDSTKEVNGNGHLYLAYEYNVKQQVKKQELMIEDDDVIETLFTYDQDDLVKEVKLDEKMSCSLERDALQRTTHEELNFNKKVLCSEYTYLQQDENTLDLIREHQIKLNGALQDTISYDYDVNGNIIKITTEDDETRYHYDKLNRIIREDNPKLNKSFTYKYDTSGNILLKKEYTYSLEETLLSMLSKDMYTYSCNGWKDRLMSFNGLSCAYDNMGRPTTYKDDEFEWTPKGELSYILNQDLDEIEYFYDCNGIRKTKIINGQRTDFIVNGTRILRSNTIKNGVKHTLTFHYLLEKLIGFTYNNGTVDKEYIYGRSIQGDITCIYDQNGVIVGEYIYDAWGNHKITKDVNGIATLNPFRYRGYYYDQETNFYYLNARYYDSQTGRFISPDVISILDETMGDINGLNLYMYCRNNPIMMIDENGNLPKWLKWLGIGAAILGAILVIAAITILTAGVGTSVLAGTLAGAILHGAAVGALIGAGIGIVAGGIIGGIASGWSAEGILIGMGIGLGAGALIGAIIGGAIGGITYVPAATASPTTPSGLDPSAIAEGVENFFSQTNKISHALTAEHNLANITIEAAKQLMTDTLINGTVGVYSAAQSAFWAVTGSEVTFIIIDGIIRISNMWIR